MITFFLSWNKIYSLAYEKKKKKLQHIRLRNENQDCIMPIWPLNENERLQQYDKVLDYNDSGFQPMRLQ